MADTFRTNPNSCPRPIAIARGQTLKLQLRKIVLCPENLPPSPWLKAKANGQHIFRATMLNRSGSEHKDVHHSLDASRTKIKYAGSLLVTAEAEDCRCSINVKVQNESGN
jgi:hypothetical protein